MSEQRKQCLSQAIDDLRRKLANATDALSRRDIREAIADLERRLRREYGAPSDG